MKILLFILVVTTRLAAADPLALGMPMTQGNLTAILTRIQPSALWRTPGMPEFGWLEAILTTKNSDTAAYAVVLTVSSGSGVSVVTRIVPRSTDYPQTLAIFEAPALDSIVLSMRVTELKAGADTNF